MRKSTVFIAVCAGAPLLVLGVGAPTAWAAPNVSVSVNGNTVVQKGPSVAISDPGHNVAVAVNGGNNPYAYYDAQAAAGTHNIAVAVNGATAYAYSGDSNTAVATGLNTHAEAIFGSNNTAIANNSPGLPGAQATGGDNNMAVANNGSSASAFGSNNTALATNGGHAAMPDGSFQTVRCHGDSCTVSP